MRFSLMALMAVLVAEMILVAGTKQTSCRGFTLVELLVVLVILALMSGIVVMSLPQDQSTARTAAGNITRLTDSLSERAVLEGRPYGLSLEDGRLELFEYSESGWILRNFPYEVRMMDEVYLTLTTADEFDYGEDKKGRELIFLGRDGITDTTAKSISPMVVFSPTGESTPFTLRIETDDEAYALMTSGLSRLEVSRVQ